ncbi:MAG: NfeD family protein [Actinobacteria bacterium]|nr:NfeD family protein [Actinomycetota bacterium]
MPAWLIWLIAAGALAAAETTTLTFVLSMFAGGALAGAVTAAVGGPALLQWIVALVVTAGLLAGVRPVARRHLMTGSGVITGAEALVGQEAVVLSPVDAHDGRVRLNGGEWSARAYDANQLIPAGTVVRVMRISGATAVVLHEGTYFGGRSLPTGTE